MLIIIKGEFIMELLKNVLKNKLFKMGVLGIAVLGIILTLAFMGPSIQSQPKDLPVALVTNDENLELKDLLTQDREGLINWTILSSKKKAIEEMNEKKFYATIILPEDIPSLIDIDTNQPIVEVIINEGKNYQAAELTKQWIKMKFEIIERNYQEKLKKQIEKENLTPTFTQTSVLVEPFNLDIRTVNEVGNNTANGNISGMFSQVLWLITFLGSMLLFVMLNKITKGQTTLVSISIKLVIGLIYSFIASLMITLFSTYGLGVIVPNKLITFLFILFTGYIFFLLQNAVLEWLGLKGVPLILLLFFFSLPILSLAPELMSSFTYYGIYIWNPILFSVEGFRSLFFFEGYGVWSNFIILAIIGFVSLLLLLLSTKKLKKA